MTTNKQSALLQRPVLWAAMLGAALLSACGGGGAGDDPAAPGPTAVSVSGTAAKGPLRGARVSAHAVVAGQVSSEALASVITDAAGDGSYSLDFAVTAGVPYVIKVTAIEGTKHVDEVTGQPQDLPAGFEMRTIVTPSATGTGPVTASITPFSEMAVDAALRAGGISAETTAQATAAVSGLLGFNPLTVPVRSVTTAVTAQEQQLALMLTSVAKLAADGSLGCSSGTPGEKVSCVVETLAASASTTDIKLDVTSGGTTLDVSAALATAVNQVLADDTLRGSVQPALMTTVVANLACTTNCGVPEAGPLSDGIAAAKLLFAELKSDLTAMFGSGTGPIADGAAHTEALAFREAMSGVQVPIETLSKDVATLLMGIDLYNDYRAGRTTFNGRGGAPGLFAGDDSLPNLNGVGCSLYADADATVLATSPDSVVSIGCRATFYGTRSVAGTTSTTRDWRHGFTITPGTTANTYTYRSRVREQVRTCDGSACSDTRNFLQTNPDGSLRAAFTGTIDTQVNSLGQIIGFAIQGELPAGFRSGTSVLANDRHSWNLTGTRTITEPKLQNTTLSGEMVSFQAGGEDGRLTIASASLGEIPVSRDADGNSVAPDAPTAVAPFGGELATGSFDFRWTTAGAELEGKFEALDSAWDASRTVHSPARGSLRATLRNIGNGVAREFVSGTYTVTTTGFANFNDTLTPSPTNSFTFNHSFVGRVSATDRPTLELSFGAVHRNDESEPSTATLQYRSVVGTTVRRTVNLTAERGATEYTLSLADPGAKLSLSATQSATTANLLYDGTIIGTVDKNAGIVTFTNGDLMSLDLGL